MATQRSARLALLSSVSLLLGLLSEFVGEVLRTPPDPFSSFRVESSTSTSLHASGIKETATQKQRKCFAFMIEFRIGRAHGGTIGCSFGRSK